MSEAYEVCAAIYGECRCAVESRQPCSAIVDLLNNGDSALDELRRIEDARIAAAFDDA